MEQRGKDLREGRSITVASSGIVLPNQASTNINQPFQQVSSLIDGVNVLPLQGGESYAQPYEKAVADATTVAEGGTPDDTDTTFDKANIAKAKLVAYSEITEEVMKLPSANYADVVLQNITVSLRKKIAKEIMVGTGATNHMVGIFSSLAEAIVPSTDISLSVIDNTTLNKIVFGYGGDEAVEGQSVLILNKKDLAAFAALRTTDGKPFHTIVTRGGYGTIDGYPFIINSACSALTDSATASAAYCMSLAKAADKTFMFTPDTTTITSVLNGSTTLTSGTNYSYASGVLTLKSAYLSTLTAGTYIFTVNTGTGATIKVTVTITA